MMKLSTNLWRFRSTAVREFRLPFPTSSNVRFAQLGAGPAFGPIKPYWAERWIELEAYRPQVIVGRAKDLQAMAERVELRMMDLSSVDHAVIVVTPCGSQLLSDVARVVLWQTFGVPVFEIFTALDHTILASECELHEGWHLEPDVHLNVIEDEFILDARGNSGLHTGLIGRIDEEPCPCGRATLRVMNLFSAARHVNAAPLAATA